MTTTDNLDVDQIINLIKPLPNVIEALCADTVFYFKSVSEISTPERKVVLLQNIKYLKSNLELLEKSII